MINKLVSTIERLFRIGGMEEPCIQIGTATAALALMRKSRLVRGQLEIIPEWDWKKIRQKISIAPGKEANPHMLVVGMSGFGKSTLLKSLIFGVHKMGIPVLVFDEHDEHGAIVSSLGGNRYDARFSGINILELDGSTVGERIAGLVAVLSSTYSLGQIQSIKLASCLWYTYKRMGAVSKGDRVLHRQPKMSDLLFEVGIFIRNAKSASEKNTLVHMREKLALLAPSSFTTSSLSVKDLMSGANSLSLGGLGNEESRIIYVNELMRRVYNLMHRNQKESGIKLYIIIDEAQRLLEGEGGEAIAKKLMEEGRKYGVGIMIATPSATRLPREIVANASVFASFYTREPGEINYIANVFGGSDPMKAITIKGALSRLKVNNAILITSRIRKPVIVETKKAAELGLIANAGLDAKKTADYDRIAAISKKPVRSDALGEAGYTEKEIQKAVENEILEKFHYSLQNTNEDWYMAKRLGLSVEHETMVLKIHELLDENRIANRASSGPGPDIEAYINGRAIPIEYETGRKGLGETKAMLESRINEYGHAMVVVNPCSNKLYQKHFSSGKIAVVQSGEIDLIPGVLERFANEQQLEQSNVQ